MKLLEFKELLNLRLDLLKATTVFTAQRELAYASNNWASILSTIFYTFSMLLFIKVIYANVHSVAGYSYNEMLLYFFVYQLTYYTNYLFTTTNLKELISDVNKGNLDMILIKPVPSLYYLMTRTVSVVSITTGAFPTLLAIFLSINLHSLDISFSNLIIATTVWVFGLISLQTFQILSALPVFWLGESQSILDLSGTIAAASSNTIPLEGYNQSLQKLLGTFIPVLISAGFTTSILLQKSNSIILFTWALVVTAICLYVKSAAWRFALRHYTSASS